MAADADLDIRGRDGADDIFVAGECAGDRLYSSDGCNVFAEADGGGDARAGCGSGDADDNSEGSGDVSGGVRTEVFFSSTGLARLYRNDHRSVARGQAIFGDVEIGEREGYCAEGRCGSG